MPSETDSLIAETLRLDGEVIDPATFKIARYEHGGGRVSFENGNERELIADFYDKAHREGFILFRTSAPRLARMLQVAIDGLSHDGEPRAVLAEIEKIAREE